MKEERNVSVVKDLSGNNVVVIHDIIFKGKRSVPWNDVENYLKRYVGDFYQIADTKEIVYIGAELPDEYAHSEYTDILKGMNAKAKANAAQGIPELIEIASGKRYTANTKAKHRKDAKFGWYKYESRFALPVFENEEIIRYNVFQVAMIFRKASNEKVYL